MRSRAAMRALATSALLVSARAVDAWTTWIATPDLSLEANPLERALRPGWTGLLLINAIVVAVMVVAIWRAAFTPPALPLDPGLDFHAFVARFWFARSGRRSLAQAVFWLPADRQVRWAFIGGPGVALVIVASVVVAAWNLLVARRVVIAPSVGRLWLVAFWSGIGLGLCVAVRVFLLRAYARYARLATPT